MRLAPVIGMPSSAINVVARAAARSYAARGWAVFPLNGKTPFAGTHGWKDATTERTRIDEMWRRYPQANVAIATGAISNLTVLDLDAKHDAAAQLARLMHPTDLMPPTAAVRTGGGGTHFYFQNAGIGNSAGLIALGIDIRGNGGYVAAPPSVHPNGTAYQWYDDAQPDHGIAEMPQWLLDLIGESKIKYIEERRNAIRTLFANGAAEGKRNDSLARMAGYLFRSNLPPLFCREVLHLWAAHRLRPAMSQDEIDTTIESIARIEERRQARR